LFAAAVMMASAEEGLEEFVDEVAGKVVEAKETVGLCVGVARGDEVLLAKGYGLADLENEVPMRAEAVLRIGSITKEFTAAAILLLAEEGKLELDDPLTKFLPDYNVQGHEVTLRHLLNHTSGIVSLTSLPSYRPGMKEEVTQEEMVARFEDEPFEFEPGEKFAYCNSGFYLLGMVVEKVAGQDYAGFLAERFWEPLGMEATYYERHGEIVPKRARGYGGWKGKFTNAIYVNMAQPFAAGALISTVGDLILWQRGLATGKVLSAASWEEMTTPGTLNNGKAAPYGCGVFVRKESGRDVIRHGGGIVGFRSELRYYPEEDPPTSLREVRRAGVTVVVLSNSQGFPPDPVARKVAGFVLGEE
jgi:CubicO group peptidase (beta-lactamase class C family)